MFLWLVYLPPCGECLVVVENVIGGLAFHIIFYIYLDRRNTIMITLVDFSATVPNATHRKPPHTHHNMQRQFIDKMFKEINGNRLLEASGRTNKRENATLTAIYDAPAVESGDTVHRKYVCM